MSTTTLTHVSALSRLGHALSDDTRTRILLALRDGPARPSALAGELGVSKQVMSNQLACLRGCGLCILPDFVAREHPDVVVTDRLAPLAVLDQVPAHAEVVDVANMLLAAVRRGEDTKAVDEGATQTV